MSFVRGLLDRIVLVAAFIAGGLVPGFITQYRQRVGGRLDQALLDLIPDTASRILREHPDQADRLIERWIGDASRFAVV